MPPSRGEITAADWRLLARAGLRLVLVRLALWFLPLGTIRRLKPGTRRADDSQMDTALPDRAAWAVAALGRRLPAMTCLVEAIALETLLADAGHVAALRIGVRRDGAAGASPHVLAHAWLEYHGRVLIGDVPNLAAYATLSSPDHRSRTGWVWEG